jgi:gas vesicle protein
MLLFIFSAKFIVGLVAGAVVALVLNNNLSKKDKDAFQAKLDQANAQIKELRDKAIKK